MKFYLVKLKMVHISKTEKIIVSLKNVSKALKKITVSLKDATKAFKKLTSYEQIL